MLIETSATSLTTSFGSVWAVVAENLPKILIAVIVFVIGWVVGVLLYRVVERVVKVLRLDEALRTAGLNEAARGAGFNLDIGRFLATLVQWFVMIVFLMSSFEIVGLNAVKDFLKGVVLGYLPLVIVAVIILIITALVADVVKKLVFSSARATGAHAANLAGTVAKYAIWIAGILAALSQLGVASGFVTTLFQGLVVAFALAFGLSFGLGGKEAAARTIERIRSEIAHHNQ